MSELVSKKIFCCIRLCLLCVYVCIGELIAHRERLSRHIQGTNAELNKYKSNIGSINNQLHSKVCSDLYIHACAYAHTCTHAHKRAHMHTQAHTHTHTHYHICEYNVLY